MGCTVLCMQCNQLAPYSSIIFKMCLHLVRTVLSCMLSTQIRTFHKRHFYLDACIRKSKRRAYKCSIWASDEPCCQNKEQFGVRLTRKRLWTISSASCNTYTESFIFHSFPCGYKKKNETRHMFCHFPTLQHDYCILLRADVCNTTVLSSPTGYQTNRHNLRPEGRKQVQMAVETSGSL